MELENVTEKSTVVRWEGYSRDTESEWNGLLVELTNEEDNLPFEVSNSISHNSDGITSAKGGVEFRKSW